MNDITDGLKCEPFLFADDTSLLKSLHTGTDVIDVNIDLEHLGNWAAQWRINFSAKKN